VIAQADEYFGLARAGSCADYPEGARSFYYTPYDISNLTTQAGKQDWPSKDPPNFLFRSVLEPLPDKYRKLIGE